MIDKANHSATMPFMKYLPTVLLLFVASIAIAQTNSVPAIPGVPADSLGWVNLLIAGLTPIVISGIKKVVPKIPTVALPFAAPIVGVILTQIEAFVTGHSTSLVTGAVAGALGLYLREVVDQSKQKLSPTPPPAP